MDNVPSEQALVHPSRAHPYTEARFVAALAILVFFPALGIALMLAKIYAAIGLVICLLVIPMVLAIYFRHIVKIWELYKKERDISTPAPLELGTLLGILYVLPILCVGIYLHPDALPAKQDASSPVVISPAEANSLRTLSNVAFSKLVSTLTQQLRELDTAYSNDEQRI